MHMSIHTPPLLARLHAPPPLQRLLLARQGCPPSDRWSAQLSLRAAPSPAGVHVPASGFSSALIASSIITCRCTSAWRRIFSLPCKLALCSTNLMECMPHYDPLLRIQWIRRTRSVFVTASTCISTYAKQTTSQDHVRLEASKALSQDHL
eukprot:scaffold79203_cov23-Tisochrysis_lutea.AAC.2